MCLERERQRAREEGRGGGGRPTGLHKDWPHPSPHTITTHPKKKTKRRASPQANQTFSILNMPFRVPPLFLHFCLVEERGERTTLAGPCAKQRMCRFSSRLVHLFVSLRHLLHAVAFHALSRHTTRSRSLTQPSTITTPQARPKRCRPHQAPSGPNSIIITAFVDNAASHGRS